MAFSLYQSLTTVPADLVEASRAFQLNGWQRFWRLEVPFGVPGLVWNMMISMSGGWFFVVASEAISVGSNTWKLPGIGSYVALALERRDIAAVFYAIATMLIVIMAYDQLLFRPLIAWSAKFRFETTASATASDPWMLKLLRRTQLLRLVADEIGALAGTIAAGCEFRSGGRLRHPGAARPEPETRCSSSPLASRPLGRHGGSWASSRGPWRARIAASAWPWLPNATPRRSDDRARELIWVPVGVWLGLRQVWARRSQPVTQFLAAFPANLLFPPFVVFIVHFRLNPGFGSRR